MDSKIEIVVDYTNGSLKSITVDNIDMDNISYITQNEISIEKWNTPSGGRANWKGLSEEIRALVADDKAKHVFEFKGSEEDKELFRQCFGDMIEGLDEAEYVNRRLNDAIKAEHSNNFEEALNCYVLIARKTQDPNKYFEAAEYGYGIFTGEHECSVTGDSSVLDKYVELLKNAFSLTKAKKDIALSLDAAKKAQIAFNDPALTRYKDDFINIFVDHLTDAANYGYSEAMNELYSIYKDGVVVEQDNKKAFAWLLKLGETGNSDAQLQIADYYSEGEFVAQNLTEAFYWYGQAAKSNAIAARKFAICCRDGIGVEVKDPIMAYTWFCIAAEADDKESKLQKALMEFHGIGTKMNQSLACNTLYELATEGNSEASYWCGVYLESMGDMTGACAYYKNAISGEHIEATYKYAKCLSEGLGVEKNEVEALKYLRKASEQNYIDAVFMEAQFYESGYGCNPNLDMAKEYYKRSGDLGYSEGYYRLALIYVNENDYDSALTWLIQAAEAIPPSLNAKNRLAYYYLMEDPSKANYHKAETLLLEVINSNTPDTVATAKYYLGIANEFGLSSKGKREQNAFSLYKEAADHDTPSVNAQYEVACCYRNGIGVEKDEEMAKWYYQKAARNNHPESQYLMAKYYDVEYAEDWYIRSADNGCAEAQYELGNYYKQNNQNDKATKYLRLAVANVHKEAAFELGCLYEKLRQKKSAQTYYKIAFDQGHLAAMYRYGLSLDNPGNKFDDKDAMKYILKAADGGLVEAQYHVGKYLFDNYLATKDRFASMFIRKVLPFNENQMGSMCVYYLQKAAMQGDCNAMKLLGDIYATGYCICGIASDIQEAMKWYSMAIDHGDVTVKAKLEKLKGGKE